MILNGNRIYDASKLVAGLQKASGGVMRLMIQVTTNASPVSHSTAWLLTDTLAVLPNYPVRDHTTESVLYKYICFTSQEPGKQIEADLVSAPDAKPDGFRPALLRLHTPLIGQALILDLASVHTGSEVFVLQYPLGQPALAFSVGSVVATDSVRLYYDASTENGSGGGPVLSATTWGLIGMHVGRDVDPRKQLHGINWGISVATILKELRALPEWGEIARYHKLTDLTAVLQKLWGSIEGAPARTELLAAAVRWSFDPQMFSADDQERLRPLVTDSSSPRWMLSAGDRQ